MGREDATTVVERSLRTAEEDETPSSQTSNGKATTPSQRSTKQVESEEDDDNDDDDDAELSHAKALVILDACKRGDIDDLKDLAISTGGFLSDAIRRQACKSESECSDPPSTSRRRS